MKTFIACTILSAIAATPAMAESFTRDGATYTYEVTSRADYKVIAGVVGDTGESFRLVVKGDKVRGRFGGKPVQFRVGAGVAAAGSEAALRMAAK